MSNIFTAMSVFQREKALLALPKPEPTEREKLAVNFRAAVFGNTFRSLSFEEEGGLRVHLRAIAMGRPDVWRVMQVSEGNLLSGAGYEQGEQSNAARDGLSMFEAADYLARFEKAQIDSGAKPAGPDKASLRYDHYESFARREGMAIDLLGQPHPTVNGEIAIDGKFAPGEADAARKAFKDRERQGVTVTVRMPPVNKTMPAPESGVMTPADLTKWQDDLDNRRSEQKKALENMLFLAMEEAVEFDSRRFKWRYIKKSKQVADLCENDSSLTLARNRALSYTYYYNRSGSALTKVAHYYFLRSRAWHVYCLAVKDTQKAHDYLRALDNLKYVFKSTGGSAEDAEKFDALVPAEGPQAFPVEFVEKLKTLGAELNEEQERVEQAKLTYANRLKTPSLPAPKA